MRNDMFWEHRPETSDVWQLFEGRDEWARLHPPLAIIDRKEPPIRQNKKPWYEVRGEEGEHVTFLEAKAAAEAMVRDTPGS